MRRRIVMFAVVTLALAIAALVVGLRGRMPGAMESSWAYEQGMLLAREDPRVARVLGAPIEAGRVDGWVRVSGETGDAELRIPVSGPLGRGALGLVARKRHERWAFERAVFDDGAAGGSVDLLVRSAN